MNKDQDHRSLPSMATDLVNQLATLFRTEAALVRTELRESINRMGSGAMEIAAGAIFLLAALLVLLQALVVALAELGLGAGWASLLVGVVVAGIGALLIRRGTSNLSVENLSPDRSVEQAKRDLEMAKGAVR